MSLDDYLDVQKINDKKHLANALYLYLIDKENTGENARLINTVDYYDYYVKVKEDLKVNNAMAKKLYKEEFNIFVNFFTIAKSNFPSIVFEFNERLFEQMKGDKKC